MVGKERKSELERLEEALLAEEEMDEAEEEYEVDAAYANYANGYRIYNTDIADGDLEDFSEEVYRAETPRRTGLWVALLLISLLVLGFFAGWLLKYLGVLG